MAAAMTVDELLDKVRRDKLFVSNLFEGTDGIWRAFLRHKVNELPSVYRGQGSSAADALSAALRLPTASKPAPQPVSTDFEDLL